MGFIKRSVERLVRRVKRLFKPTGPSLQRSSSMSMMDPTPSTSRRPAFSRSLSMSSLGTQDPAVGLAQVLHPSMTMPSSSRSFAKKSSFATKESGFVTKRSQTFVTTFGRTIPTKKETLELEAVWPAANHDWDKYPGQKLESKEGSIPVEYINVDWDEKTTKENLLRRYFPVHFTWRQMVLWLAYHKYQYLDNKEMWVDGFDGPQIPDHFTLPQIYERIRKDGGDGRMTIFYKDPDHRRV